MLIREPEVQDMPALLPLVQGLALHHGSEPSVSIESLIEDLFGEGPWVHALVAERDGRLVGYAAILRLARFQFGQRGIDLHHLYVLPEARGQGIGGALVAEALKLGKLMGATYATVTATPDNQKAQDFYRSLGFSEAPRFGARFWVPLGVG